MWFPFSLLSRHGLWLMVVCAMCALLYLAFIEPEIRLQNAIMRANMGSI